MSRKKPVDLYEPIEGECLRCGHGTLRIYPGGAACSNCSPDWLEPRLIDYMEGWRKTHRYEVTGG